LSYVLPLLSDAPRADLVPYLAWLAPLVDVVVVDGSEPPVVAAHRAAWPAGVRHVALPAERRTPMGKVGGVLVGLELARDATTGLVDVLGRADGGKTSRHDQRERQRAARRRRDHRAAQQHGGRLAGPAGARGRGRGRRAPRRDGRRRRGSRASLPV